MVKIEPTYFDPILQAYVIKQYSIEDEEYPPVKHRVRAFAHLSTNIIKPLNQGLLLTTLGQLDFGGNIPTALLNLGLRAAPLGLSKLIHYARHHGVPPKIIVLRGQAILLKHEFFNPDTKCYKATVECHQLTELKIKIDPKLYPHGVRYQTNDLISHLVDNYLVIQFLPQEHDIDICIEPCLVECKKSFFSPKLIK